MDEIYFKISIVNILYIVQNIYKKGGGGGGGGEKIKKNRIIIINKKI